MMYIKFNLCQKYCSLIKSYVVPLGPLASVYLILLSFNF